MGGAGSSLGTGGRGRPTIAVAMTKIVAWREIAMTGTTAYHHCLVRHHTMRATMTQTPMTYSVLPMCDQ